MYQANVVLHGSDGVMW